jgi:hypothetical protein
MSVNDDAKALVESFAGRTSPPGVWLHINRADLAQGLRVRIDNPDLINQGQASICGPADYKVSLFINADMLTSATQDNASVTPDHWVGLTSPISFTGIEADPASKVSFGVYTWGGRQNVPVSGSLSIKHFLWNYYGYVGVSINLAP